MYSLFSNVIVVNGSLRSVLYDIQRESYHFIPLWLGNFLSENDQFELSELGEFKSMFIYSELIHAIDRDEVELFPRIEMDYHIPCIIEVLVFDCSIYNSLKIEVLSIIEALNIQKALFYVRKQECVKNLERILNELKYSRLNQIEIVCFEQLELNINIINHEHRIRKIYFYKSPEKKVESIAEFNRLDVYFNWSFDDRMLYHQNPNFLNVNLKLFSESQHFNTYYHKRLYISSNGDISNGEFPPPVGNIKDITDINTLTTLIQSKEFTSLFHTRKDVIDVCKDCEFRHMCTDNRIPIQRQNLQWYHDLECNYNPYICKWKGDEGFLSLSECGVISNEEGFYIDREHINNVNEKLWAE